MFGLRLNQNRVFFQAHRNCLCLSRLTKINALALHSTFRSWKWDHPSITGSSTWYPTVVSANLPCPDLSMMSNSDNPPLWHLWKTDRENLLQTTFPHSVTRNFKLEKNNLLSNKMQANKNSSVFDGQQHSLVNFVWKQLDKKECHTCASTHEISLHTRPKKIRSTFFYMRIYIQNVGNIVVEAFVNANASGKICAIIKLSMWRAAGTSESSTAHVYSNLQYFFVST